MGTQGTLELDTTREETTIQNPGEFYAELWNRYLALVSSHVAAFTEFGRQEHREYGTPGETLDQDYGLVFRSYNGPDMNLKKVASGIFLKLLALAAKRFAPAGGSLSIDSYHFSDYKAQRIEDDYSETNLTFDPAALWRALEEKYGGDAGEIAAYRQAADRIVDRFDLDQAWGSPVQKKGRVEFTQRLYTRKGFDGGVEITINGVDAVVELLDGLGTFMRLSGYEDSIHFTRNHYLRSFRSRAIRSRHTSACDILKITTFNNKAVFSFTAEAAGRLQVFLAKYGNTGS